MHLAYRSIRACAPLVSLPKVISLKNRFFRASTSLFGDWAVFAVTLILIAGFYLCSLHTLAEWQTSPVYQANIPLLVGTLVCAVGILVIISSAVTSIGSLLLSQDMELLLSAPIRTSKIVGGKLSEVALATSWMLLLFLVPPFIAVGNYWGAPSEYYALSIVFFVATVWFSAAIGMIIALLFCSIISAKTGRAILAVMFVGTLIVITILSNPGHDVGVFSLLSSTAHTSHIEMVKQYPYLPAVWIGRALRQLLNGSTSPILLIIAIIFLLNIALTTGLNWLYTKLYSRAYTHLQNSSSGEISLRLPRSFDRKLFFKWMSRPRFALITREFFSFSRDLTQTIQMGMLLSICILYLFNIGRLEYPSNVGVTMLQAWDVITVLLCFLLSSLITLSICSRFVFPSISLEGKTLWILQSSPLSSSEILRAKYLAWLVPTALIGMVIFMSGGFALGLPPIILLLLVVMGLIITRTLVALAIGMGTRFAFFEWEHPTQLATTVGNFLFLSSGVAIVGIQTSIAAMVFGAYYFLPELFNTPIHRSILFAFGIASLLVVHTFTAKVALRIGIRALDNLYE